MPSARAIPAEPSGRWGADPWRRYYEPCQHAKPNRTLRPFARLSYVTLCGSPADSGLIGFTSMACSMRPASESIVSANRRTAAAASAWPCGPTPAGSTTSCPGCALPPAVGAGGEQAPPLGAPGLPRRQRRQGLRASAARRCPTLTSSSSARSRAGAASTPSARTSWPRASTRTPRPTSPTLSPSWRPRARQELPRAAFRTSPRAHRPASSRPAGRAEVGSRRLGAAPTPAFTHPRA
jgi:hypothetical protein